MSTFLNLPEKLSDPRTAKTKIMPIPYEGTVSFLKGTSRGPEAILSVSDQIEHFDEELRYDFTQTGIATLSAIQGESSPEAQMRRILTEVQQADLFHRNIFPIFIGGEHSISSPIIRCAAEKYDDISVLQFDAHADLRNSFHGSAYSHGSVMRRILEITPSIVQVGIRSFSKEEADECPEQISRIITPAQLDEDIKRCIDKILFGLTNNVYITFDIDAFDPSFAPGTGTPEPGGISWRQALAILKTVFERKNVVGADIVEVLPLGGNNVITEMMAARLIGKMIAYKNKND